MGGNLTKIIFGSISVAVAFIIFPIIITGAEQTRLATNISSYTGLSSLVTIGPTLAFVVLILGGLLSMGAGAWGIARGGSRRSRR